MSLPFGAPQVIRWNPANQAVDVPTDAAVEMAFSLELDPRSIESAIEAHDELGGHVALLRHYDPFTRTVTLRPQEGRWSPGVTYRILAKGTSASRPGDPVIRSASGVPMLTDFLLTFTTALAPALAGPVLLDPADESRVPVSAPLRFAWQAVGGASGYELVVSGSPTLEPAVIHESVAGTSYVPSFLPASGNYWWRVRALDGDLRPGAWSERHQFVVSEAAPVEATAVRARVLSTFPEDGFASVALNLKSIVVRIDRPLPEDLVGLTLFSGYGEPVDEDPSRETHGTLSGSIRQEVQPDGTALLIWELTPLG